MNQIKNSKASEVRTAVLLSFLLTMTNFVSRLPPVIANLKVGLCDGVKQSVNDEIGRLLRRSSSQ